MKNIIDSLAFFERSFDGIYIVDTQRKIIFWNESAEVITGYTKAEMVDRYCYDNILMHTDENGTQLCLCGCPLHKSIQTNEMACASVFLRHKNGYRVPVSVRSVPVVEDHVVVGAIEFFQIQQDRIERMYNLDELQSLALTDHLTTLPNRSYMETFLQSRINEHPVLGVQFGVLFIDIDHFKVINDTYGHDVGDLVLQNLSKTFSNNIRNTDRIGRWGGEEFVGVCLCSDEAALVQLAKKIRVLAERTNTMFRDQPIHVTISIGATLYQKGESSQQLVTRADNLMYQSKAEGRNRVTIG